MAGSKAVQRRANKKNKLTLAMVLRIQSCVEQLRETVQSGIHGGRLLLNFVVWVVMAMLVEASGKRKQNN